MPRDENWKLDVAAPPDYARAVCTTVPAFLATVEREHRRAVAEARRIEQDPDLTLEGRQKRLVELHAAELRALAGSYEATCNAVTRAVEEIDRRVKVLTGGREPFSPLKNASDAERGIASRLERVAIALERDHAERQMDRCLSATDPLAAVLETWRKMSASGDALSLKLFEAELSRFRAAFSNLAPALDGELADQREKDAPAEVKRLLNDREWLEADVLFSIEMLNVELEDPKCLASERLSALMAARITLGPLAG